MKNLLAPLSALLAGGLFGIGLTVAGMTEPGKVLGFLDLGGRWDPSLAFVMGAALAVTTPLFWWARRNGQSWFAGPLQWPTRRDVDARLLGGAALFGVGWGLAGLCPGPAIANLALLSPRTLGFVAAMIGGMALREAVDRLQAARARA